MDRLVLDLGSDSTYCEDYTTLDIVHLKGSKYVVCNLIKGIPFEDNSVDAVVSNHFIEHLSLKDCLNLFKEILRVLKPKGSFTVAVPDLESIVKGYMSGKISYDVLVGELYNADLKAYGIEDADLSLIDEDRMLHRGMFDFLNLKRFLKDVGFINIEQVHLGSGDLKPWRDIKLYPLDGAYSNVKEEAMVYKSFQLRCEKP